MQDFYIAIIKGEILKAAPFAFITELSPAARDYTVDSAAFAVRNTYPCYPKGSVHLIYVEHPRIAIHRYLLVVYKEQYFFVPDNGLFSLIMDDPDYTAYKLHISPKESLGMPLRDILVKSAAEFVKTGDPTAVGTRLGRVMTIAQPIPEINENQVKGNVQYVDHYGNVITNLQPEHLTNLEAGSKFSLGLKNSQYQCVLRDTYYQVSGGSLTCFFNALNYFEVALSRGSATQLLGLEQNDEVLIML